jgi:RimJ/RimL family protein N-acetyltransferase
MTADAAGSVLTSALTSERLSLEPLRVDHAAEMAVLLDDAGLHTFTGGKPATSDELRDRYARQIVGRSSDGTHRWHNWVARERASALAVGFVQATVEDENEKSVAEVAWVIGTAHQGRGYAREAAAAMTDWLRSHGVDVVVAHIHPHHEASMAVARALGLHPTSFVVDGEVRWEGWTAWPVSREAPSASTAKGGR